MSNLITLSFFVGDRIVPNRDDGDISTRLEWFIKKYEPECLIAILCYPLYKALLDENPTLQTITPGSTELRNSEQIQVDHTPGLISGQNSALFDGTLGKPNFLGWEIKIEEISGTGTLIKNVEYDWDEITGLFRLLKSGAKFAANQWYNITFEPNVNPSTVTYGTETTRMSDLLNGKEYINNWNKLDKWEGLISAVDESLITDYIYVKWLEWNVSQNTGYGVAIKQTEKAFNLSPAQKITDTWNQFSRHVRNMVKFLMANVNKGVYPEFTTYCAQKALSFSNSINEFDI